METAYNFSDSPKPMTLGKTIRDRRKARGWSQADLAKAVGISQPAVKKIEDGTTKDPRKLLDIARVLQIPIADIDPTFGSGVQVPLTTPESRLVGERNLPVYAAAEGGKGAMVLSSDPVDYVRRPAPLENVRDGYGIIIVSESMVPEFRPGDTALVHPHLAPAHGEAAVFYSEDAGGEVLVTIKSLVRVTATHWHVQQWNPPKKLTLSRKEWPKCHRVVGRYSRR